ncbi:hypothetical protein H0H93_006070, partial [Arthromyces matolae]
SIEILSSASDDVDHGIMDLMLMLTGEWEMMGRHTVEPPNARALGYLLRTFSMLASENSNYSTPLIIPGDRKALWEFCIGVIEIYLGV